MALLLLLAFLVVPIVELAVIVQVAGSMGVLPTLALLVLISVAGAWLVKREGLGIWRRLQATLARGELPTDNVVDGLCILFAGALLLTPGFVTDGLGFLLLIPPSRAVVRAVLLRRFRRRIEAGLAGGASGPGFAAWGAAGGRGGRVYVGEAVIVDGREEPGAGDGRPELGGER